MGQYLLEEPKANDVLNVTVTIRENVRRIVPVTVLCEDPIVTYYPHGINAPSPVKDYRTKVDEVFAGLVGSGELVVRVQEQKLGGKTVYLVWDS